MKNSSLIFIINRFPPIKRGTPVDLYGTSSDNRLLEYDFDELLYEANSAYQNIKIVHSLSFGNLLVLDELQSISRTITDVLNFRIRDINILVFIN